MKLLRELGDLFTEVARRRIHPDCVLLYVRVELRGSDVVAVARARCPGCDYEVETSLERLPEVTIRECVEVAP
jgi:methyl coenzyme M reductase gamma subunit